MTSNSISFPIITPEDGDSSKKKSKTLPEVAKATRTLFKPIIQGTSSDMFIKPLCNLRDYPCQLHFSGDIHFRRYIKVFIRAYVDDSPTWDKMCIRIAGGQTSDVTTEEVEEAVFDGHGQHYHCRERRLIPGSEPANLGFFLHRFDLSAV